MPLTPRSPSAAAAPEGPAEPPGSLLVPTRPAQGPAQRPAQGPARLARWARIARPLCGGAVLLFLMGDDGISREEYLCEAAVLHLSGCCPDFPASELHCVQNGCDGNVIPDLREERSMCLQNKSCEDLIASGACDKARWESVNACNRELCSEKVPPC